MKYTSPLRKQTGFTIVELLIVIVVIAILAAIIVVAYSGVTNRAAEAGVKEDLRTAKTQLELEKIEEGAYPQTLPAPIGANNDYIHQYTVSADGSTYCLTTMHKSVANTANHVDQASGIKPGACDGHDGNPTGVGGGAVAASMAQRSAQCCGSGQQSVTLGQKPKEGNLIVAMMGWVSPPSVIANLSGSGWQTVISGYNPYEDYGTKVVWKIAGSNEPTTYDFTTSAASSSNNLMVEEFTIENAQVGNPQVVQKSDLFIESATPGTINATVSPSLGVSVLSNRRGIDRLSNGGLVWSNGMQDNFKSDNDSNVTLNMAWQLYASPGSYTTTAWWGDSSGSATTDYATVGLLNFPLE